VSAHSGVALFTGRPATSILTGAVAGGAVLSAWGPRRDIDLWWRILLGEEALAGIAEPGEDWATLPSKPGWRSTQLPAEIGLAALHGVVGQGSHVIARLLIISAATTALLWVTQPWHNDHRVLRLAASVCGLAVIVGFTQERPASMVMFLVTPAGWCIGWMSLHPRQHMRWGVLLLAAGIGAAWIALHPSWLMAAAVLIAGLLGRAWYQRQAVVAAAAIGVMALTLIIPQRNVQAAVEVAHAAQPLVEWQRTRIESVAVLPALTVALLLIGYFISRREFPVPALLLIAGVLTAFSTVAWRHVAPATLLGIGVLIAVLDSNARHTLSPRLPRTLVAMVGCVLLAAGAAAWRLPPWSASDDVAELAGVAVCVSNDPVVIAAHYDDNGAALFGARRSGCTGAAQSRVALDGRADRYGAELIVAWQHEVTGSGGPLLSSASPTHALVRADAALVPHLLAADWVPLSCRGQYFLLANSEQ